MVYGLFLLIVGGFIWKGIPFIVSKFETMGTLFLQTLEKQQKIFSEDLQKITEVYMSEIKHNNDRYQALNTKLDEIKVLLEKKKITSK